MRSDLRNIGMWAVKPERLGAGLCRLGHDLAEE